jgi:GNAT superfamily N-acetyltransferase
MDDLPTLEQMLFEAFSWRQGAPLIPINVVLARPEIRRYVIDWGRPGDMAVIAISDPEGIPIGAAWYRIFPADDAGYGFVDATVPELSIGVDAKCRGDGVGCLLLKTLCERARSDGMEALSLSVEPDNRIAVGLYERLGFQRVGANGGSLTMMVSLSESVSR